MAKISKAACYQVTEPIIASEKKDSLETLGNGLPRSLALWEIASVITSCLIAEWAVLVFVGKSKLVMAIPIALAVGLMFFSHRTRGETLREIGVRTDNFLFSCRSAFASHSSRGISYC